MQKRQRNQQRKKNVAERKVPDFLVYWTENPLWKQEIEYACSHIKNWDGIEEKIWIKVFNELCYSLKIEGRERLLLKNHLMYPISNIEKFNEFIDNTPTKVRNIYCAFLTKNFEMLNNNLSDNYESYMKLFHIVMHVLFNKGGDHLSSPYFIKLAEDISVFSMVQTCNQICENRWCAEYRYILTGSRLYYKNPIFYFETKEDAALVKMIY